MTLQFIRDKNDGVWNVFDGEDFLPICEYCKKLQCHFRSDMLTGCDGFLKSQEVTPK